MDDFLLRALIGGCGVAAVAAPLGVFVVWRRMAFFGGTLAHSALLGVALGVVLGINLDIGIFAVCAAVAFAMAALARRATLPNDTLLGILAHAGLAAGLIALAVLGARSTDLMTFLLGDVLSTTATDIAFIYVGGAIVLGILAMLWRPLLSATVHEELARVEGVAVNAVNLVYMLLLAVVVALAMKVVGILLVTSLIVIPAATARAVSRTPEQMAVLAALAGCLSVGAGLWASVVFDAPSGPAIVIAAFALFVLSATAPALSRRG